MARRQTPGHQKKRSSKARPFPTSVGRPNAPGTLVVDEAAHGAETVEPQALVITHTFDPGDDGTPYAATIRLVGRLDGATSLPNWVPILTVTNTTGWVKFSDPALQPPAIRFFRISPP